MTSSSPLVSILIPCFNAGRWVGAAIDSALAQTYAPKEVVVIDDGSTDESLDVIRRYEGRIRWETGANRGGNAARNRLLDLSRGAWLQYLDADDYLTPDKVAGQMRTLAAHPHADIVFGPSTVEHWSGDGSRRELRAIPEPHDIPVLLARWFLPQTGASLWRKQAILDAGGWRIDQPCCQEHELYLRLLMAGKRFHYDGAGGSVYRQWSVETLCRKNVPEVHRQRLAIERRLEDHLRAEGQLTAGRLSAINEARFEMARMAWLYSRSAALDIIRTIRRSQPDFVPRGATAPRLYRFFFRVLGFHGAEIVAGMRRAVIAPKAAAS